MVRAQLGHAARRSDRDLHLAIGAVLRVVRRSVADQILVAQLPADALADGSKLVQILHRIMSAARLLGELFSLLWTFSFLRRPLGRLVRIEDALGVKLNVGFA